MATTCRSWSPARPRSMATERFSFFFWEHLGGCRGAVPDAEASPIDGVVIETFRERLPPAPQSSVLAVGVLRDVRRRKGVRSGAAVCEHVGDAERHSIHDERELRILPMAGLVE